MAEQNIHVREGWTFERIMGEDVALIQDGTFKIAFNAAEWASIIAAVSAGGSSSDKYRAALALHRNDERYWSKEYSRLRVATTKAFEALSAIKAWLKAPCDNPPKFELVDEALAALVEE